MTTALQTAEAPTGIIAAMASQFGMDARAFEATLRNTVMPANTAKEQVAAFLLVAKQYELNPFTKEIYAFPAKGGIQPVVSIDGWLKLMNSHPQFDGMELVDQKDEGGNVAAVTAKIYRKDRTHPTEVTEYMGECKRNTEPWQKWPARMLRHKATIQGIRYAFGFAGIMEPDEAERMIDKPSTGLQLARAAVVEVVTEPEISEAQQIERQGLVAKLADAANIGRESLMEAWKGLTQEERRLVGTVEFDRLKGMLQ
jgi:phage recombination protein Bet